MTVTLNISNDAELRAYIKEQIRGQVTSLAREEVMEILREEIRRKTPTIDPDQVAIDEIKKKIDSFLKPSRYGEPTEVTKLAREILEVELKKILQQDGLRLK